MDCISNIESIFTIIAILISGFVAIFFYVQFTPIIEIRIISELFDKNTKLILRFEIENKSKVRAIVQSIQIQILEYEKKNRLTLSEWVPFSSHNVYSLECPSKWQEPTPICETTERIYPGEIVSVERLYTISEDMIYHVGLQLKVKYTNCVEKCIPKKAKQWTTTKIIYPTGSTCPLNEK